jgi:AcrR family transcriptional regulator
MATRKKQRDTYHHGDLRRALLDVALERVLREGPDTLSLREVARDAGVSHTAPYRHFASRDALVAAIADEGFSMLRQMLVDGAAGGRDPLERFLGQGEAYVRFALEHPAHFRVMFATRLPADDAFPALAESGRAAFQELVNAIAECQQARQIRRGDPMRLALSAWSMAHGLATLLVEQQLERMFPAELRPQLIRDAMDVVVRGLA